MLAIESYLLGRLSEARLIFPVHSPAVPEPPPVLYGVPPLRWPGLAPSSYLFLKALDDSTPKFVEVDAEAVVLPLLEFLQSVPLVRGMWANRLVALLCQFATPVSGDAVLPQALLHELRAVFAAHYIDTEHQTARRAVAVATGRRLRPLGSDMEFLVERALDLSRIACLPRAGEGGAPASDLDRRVVAERILAADDAAESEAKRSRTVSMDDASLNFAGQVLHFPSAAVRDLFRVITGLTSIEQAP